MDTSGFSLYPNNVPVYVFKFLSILVILGKEIWKSIT